MELEQPTVINIACRACGAPLPERARFCSECGFRMAPGDGHEPALGGDPLVGRILGGRYRIEEAIGRGGMGVVYRVEHVRIGKSMAMKVLHGELARDRDVMRRFRREAETVSKLDHPNTVQVFDFGTAEGLSFLVMELLSGRDLGTIVQDEGVLTFGRAAHIVSQVCDSVHQAHQRGIVHRDLKPENVRVLSDRSSPDFVKVLDFGLAKLREGRDELGSGSVTRAGFLLGTPLYMAPEQIRGEGVDERVDVYAVGAMLYKAVVGVPPFFGTSPLAILTKHLTEHVVPPSVRSPQRDLPRECDDILLRALEKDPSKRFASMNELGEALREVMSRSSSPPVSITTTAAMPRPESVASVVTKDEFESYERRLRAQSRMVSSVFALGVVGAGAFGYQAWTNRPTPVSTAETEPNDGPAGANDLALGQTLEGQIGQRRSIEIGDADLYRFRLDAPAHVRVDVSAIPNLDLGFELYALGRAEPIFTIDGSDLGGAEGVPDVALEAGTYLARIHESRELGSFPTENVSDVYRVTVRSLRDDEPSAEPDETEARATVIDAPGEWRGHFGWTGDIDTFCVAPHASPYVVGVAVTDAIDPFIELHLGGGALRRVDEHRQGEGESLRLVASEQPTCFHVAASERATLRSDPATPYVVTVR